MGRGLAHRWIEAGYPVVIGSRNIEKAQATVADFLHQLNVSAPLQAMEYSSAAEAGEIVALPVPFAHQQSTLEVVRAQLRGKILISVTVPLVPPKIACVQLPEGGSAGQMAQEFLGDDVRVVTAFQNVAAVHLNSENDLVCDVGMRQYTETREKVIQLTEAAGLTGYHAGSIANSAAVEAMSSLLLFMNTHYGVVSGIKVTGFSESVEEDM